MKNTPAILAAVLLAGCSLTPKQFTALDGAVCNKAKVSGIDFTTTAVGGASKSGAVSINGADCSITTIGVTEAKP